MVSFFYHVVFFQTEPAVKPSDMLLSHGYPDLPTAPKPNSNIQGNYESCWKFTSCGGLSNTMMLVYSELAYNLTYDCHTSGSYSSIFFKYRISSYSFRGNYSFLDFEI